MGIIRKIGTTRKSGKIVFVDFGKQYHSISFHISKMPEELRESGHVGPVDFTIDEVGNIQDSSLDEWASIEREKEIG